MRQKPIRRLPIGRRARENRCDEYSRLGLGPAPSFRGSCFGIRFASRVLGTAAVAKSTLDAFFVWFRREYRHQPGQASLAHRLLTDRQETVEPDAAVGPMLTGPDAPRLFRFLGKIANRMAAPPPTEVRISYLPACGVMELAGRGPMARRVLIIGYPCLQIWNQAEFAAVLGHEFAHWKNRDSRISRRLMPLFTVPRNSDNRGTLRRAVSLVAGWTLHRPAIAICRNLEYRADAAAARAFGPESLASALRKLAVAQPIFEQVLHDFADRGRPTGNVYSQFLKTWRRIPFSLARRLLLKNVLARPHPCDLHPPLAQRLARLDRESGPTIGPNPGALQLIDDRDAIRSVLHNRIFADRREKISVFQRDEIG